MRQEWKQQDGDKNIALTYLWTIMDYSYMKNPPFFRMSHFIASLNNELTPQTEGRDIRCGM